MLYKVVAQFKSVDEIIKHEQHSTETFLWCCSFQSLFICESKRIITFRFSRFALRFSNKSPPMRLFELIASNAMTSNILLALSERSSTT